MAPMRASTHPDARVPSMPHFQALWYATTYCVCVAATALFKSTMSRVCDTWQPSCDAVRWQPKLPKWQYNHSLVRRQRS